MAVQEDIAIDFHAVSGQCVATGVFESPGSAISKPILAVTLGRVAGIGIFAGA